MDLSVKLVHGLPPEIPVFRTTFFDSRLISFTLGEGSHFPGKWSIHVSSLRDNLYKPQHFCRPTYWSSSLLVTFTIKVIQRYTYTFLARISTVLADLRPWTWEQDTHSRTLSLLYVETKDQAETSSRIGLLESFPAVLDTLSIFFGNAINNPLHHSAWLWNLETNTASRLVVSDTLCATGAFG